MVMWNIGFKVGAIHYFKQTGKNVDAVGGENYEKNQSNVGQEIHGAPPSGATSFNPRAKLDQHHVNSHSHQGKEHTAPEGDHGVWIVFVVLSITKIAIEWEELNF